MSQKRRNAGLVSGLGQDARMFFGISATGFLQARKTFHKSHSRLALRLFMGLGRDKCADAGGAYTAPRSWAGAFAATPQSRYLRSMPRPTAGLVLAPSSETRELKKASIWRSRHGRYVVVAAAEIGFPRGMHPACSLGSPLPACLPWSEACAVSNPCWPAPGSGQACPTPQNAVANWSRPPCSSACDTDTQASTRMDLAAAIHAAAAPFANTRPPRCSLGADGSPRSGLVCAGRASRCRCSSGRRCRSSFGRRWPAPPTQHAPACFS
jgi:hypothetical protein